MEAANQRAFDIVKKLFKNDYGEPFEMTAGQIELFRAIYEKQNPRIQFDCYTQYGKSDVVSMAVLLRVTTFGEKWIILGATQEKAGIIVGKLIKHIFENDYTLSKFEVGDEESIEHIRRERSRSKLTFKVDDNNIGTVIAMSADARAKSKDAGDILIGHGAQHLIEDDAALIPDPIHGKAMRMLGGHKQNFLLKITNSFGRNHAYRSAIDSDNVVGTQAKESPAKPLFHRIVIDYLRGIGEGRITEEFIQEMRASLDPVMFGILYACVYPPADMIEDGGWMPLLTEEQVVAAQGRAVQSRGSKRLGVDVSEGTNYNAFVIRTDNWAGIKEKTLEKDLMKTAEKILTTRDQERVNDGQIWVDAVGIGAGVFSRVLQLGAKINAFKGGDAPTDKGRNKLPTDVLDFYNLRAEVYWTLRVWVIEGGALEASPDWMQLTKIRYRTTSEKKIQIMSKEEMRARSLLQASESTDIPDALSMTFAPSKLVQYEQKQSQPLAPYYPEIDGMGYQPTAPVGQSLPLTPNII